MSNNIRVEVAYALPDEQAIIELEVAEGTTALEAARQSGVTQRFEGIDLDNAKLG
ncbi:MAG: RnfH family protein, partial [Halioglobus sp.]|nr:RnfH family protein [Halioglobus sp.]